MKTVFDFNTLFRDPEVYQGTKENVKKYLTDDISRRKESAAVLVGDSTHAMTLGKVLINLIAMKVFVGLDHVIIDDDLFDFDAVTETNLDIYFNRLLLRYKENPNHDYDYFRKEMASIIDELDYLSTKTNVLVGNSISFLDFVKLWSKDEAARDIFSIKFYENDKDNFQFSEVESKFKELGKQIERYFLSHPNTELYPFVASKTGINIQQLTQAVGLIGLKPDIDGSVIPVVIEDNYLTGLTNLQNYFINAKGTRKALDLESYGRL